MFANICELINCKPQKFEVGARIRELAPTALCHIPGSSVDDSRTQRPRVMDLAHLTLDDNCLTDDAAGRQAVHTIDFGRAKNIFPSIRQQVHSPKQLLQTSVRMVYCLFVCMIYFRRRQNIAHMDSLHISWRHDRPIQLPHKGA